MTVDLLDQILPHVKDAIYPERRPLPIWKFKDGDVPAAQSSSLRDQAWPSTQIPYQWIGDNKTIWFRHEVTIPPGFIGKPVAVLLEIPEALLFVDGKLCQGLDVHHKESYLTEKGRSHQSFLFAIRASSGRKRGINSFSNAELVVINRTARALYNGLTTLGELDKLASHGSQESKDVRELIRRTLIFLKYFKPEGEEYPNAIGRAYKFLTTSVENEFKTTIPGMVHLIAQSRLDPAWLWTIQETNHKAAATFSNALRVLEEFPGSTFTQSQAFLYELTGRSYPDVLRLVKLKVAEGRWEPVGSMWVEPDCNIPGGESLIRNILLGKKYFKAEFGSDSSVAWLPDSPGFASNLPQILRKSGFSFFFTAKPLKNDKTKFPHNSFWWEGLDGTRILSHVPPVGPEGQLEPKDIKKAWDDFTQKEETPLAAQTFGFGNGGGGISADQMETGKVIETISGLSPSKTSNARDFFTALELQAKALPVWDKELYVEKNRGTYSTQAWIKHENRGCESLLYQSELYASLAGIMGKSPQARRYPVKELERAWSLLIQNQSKEIISGTSISDVYKDSRNDFAEIRTLGDKIIDRSLSAFVEPARKSKDFSFTAFNALEHERNEYVEVSFTSSEKCFTVKDNEGNLVEHQFLDRSRGTVTLLCYLRSIQPFSSKSFVVTPVPGKAEAPEPWKTSNRIIESPFYRIRLDKKGGISSLYDRQLRRELVEHGKRANLLQTFKDVPEQADVWELEPGFDRHKLDSFVLRSFAFAETGPLRARIRFEYRSDRGSSIIQDMMLYHHEKRIDFATRVNWREQRTLLKAVFPLNIKSHVATFETQFGVIVRTTRPKEDIDKAKFEVPIQQWFDFSEPKLGVSILNDGKYGCDALHNVLRLTLIRSPLYPHPHEPWRLNDDKCTDQGEHRFTYSLYPHSGDWKKGRTIQQARSLNIPLRIVENSIGTMRTTPLELSKPNVIVSCLKKAEDSDDLVLRLYESFGESTDCAVKFGFTVKSAVECDLTENQLKQMKVSKGKLALRFKPFEIKTVKLIFRKK